jgi:hypothetical protein
MGLDTLPLPLPLIVSLEEETVYLPPPSLRYECRLLVPVYLPQLFLYFYNFHNKIICIRILWRELLVEQNILL